MRRLLLVRHPPTSATRRSAFPLDEPLDAAGRTAAAALAGALPPRCELLCSPELRCREAAAAAALDARPEPALAECDYGRWGGVALEDLGADAANAWRSDPDATPHGGESLTAFAMRVATWIDDQARGEGTAAAITHGGVVKAAVVHVLDAPLSAFWRIDAAPLSVTELHAHDGRWTVTRVNSVVAA